MQIPITLSDTIELLRIIGTVLTYVVLVTASKFYYMIKQDIQKSQDEVRDYVNSEFTRKEVFNMHLKTLHNGNRFGEDI